jgi:hypothetical protein
MDYYGAVTKSGFQVWLSGKGKVPVRTANESSATRSDFDHPHIAVSQIAQELPMPDHLAWRNGLFAPEYPYEVRERRIRELERHMGGLDNPHSLAFASQWARARRKETRTWRKFQI